MIKTLKELKLHLPAEKRHGYRSSTLSTLKYALRCVKQVEGKGSFGGSIWGFKPVLRGLVAFVTW